MILLLALVLSIVLAYLLGGRLSRLAALPVRGTGLALAALGIQVTLIYVIFPDQLQGLVRVVLLAFSYLLLALFVWWNRRLPGMWILGAGLAANWLVILVNGGYMPVTYEALVAAGKGHLVSSADIGTFVYGSKDILLPLEATRLWFLSDIFVIPPPFPIPSVFSVGDALIAVGLLVFIPNALGANLRIRPAGTLHTS